MERPKKRIETSVHMVTLKSSKGFEILTSFLSFPGYLEVHSAT